MSEGQLRCCGSSLFLKKTYGVGYQLTLEKNAAENAFFAEVWQSQKDFAAVAVPFWAGSQASNAALGKAFADSVK